MGDIRTSAKPALEISLALSGGAARGTFHLGFVQALQEHAIQIKVISGCSAGALVGGALACGMKPKEILETLQSKAFRGAFRFNWFRKSLFSINKKDKVLKSIFPVEKIEDTEIPFFACITDMGNHKVLYANKGDGINLITASCGLIPFFEAVDHEDKVFADGGIMNLMPTSPLLAYDYPILGINLIPLSTPKRLNLITLTKWTIQLLLSTGLQKDIERCQWYVSPAELSRIKMFSLNGLQKGYDLGYQSGLSWCKKNI